MERTDDGPQICTAGTNGMELSFNFKKKIIKINIENEISKYQNNSGFERKTLKFDSITFPPLSNFTNWTL